MVKRCDEDADEEEAEGAAELTTEVLLEAVSQGPK